MPEDEKPVRKPRAKKLNVQEVLEAVMEDSKSEEGAPADDTTEVEPVGGTVEGEPDAGATDSTGEAQESDREVVREPIAALNHFPGGVLPPHLVLRPDGGLQQIGEVRTS